MKRLRESTATNPKRHLMVEPLLTPFEVQKLRLRFWAKVDRNGPYSSFCDPTFGNCWLWTASLGRKRAKASIDVKGKTIGAARVSWFLTHGEWPKKNVCHVCDHPACMRPEHHFEGTDEENVLDARAKARGGTLIMVSKGTRAYAVPPERETKLEIEWGVD